MTTSQAARNAQSKKSKAATLDLLKNKKRATSEFTIYVDDGEAKQPLTIKYQAIGAVEYDKLVSKHPPTADQRVEGASFNIDTFGPAIIAKSAIDPELSEADAKEIWNSPEWSRGDLMVLFRHAIDLNNRGVDIPFTETGSE